MHVNSGFRVIRRTQVQTHYLISCLDLITDINLNFVSMLNVERVFVHFIRFKTNVI